MVCNHVDEMQFRGNTQAYDSEIEMIKSFLRNPYLFKGRAIVIRNEGPKGGPCMPELITSCSLIFWAGLHKFCAIITDGRFSYRPHGYLICQVLPEAQDDGPLATVKDGDNITVDSEKRFINVINIHKHIRVSNV